MIGEVQPHGHEIAHIGNTGADPHPVRRHRQRDRVERGESGERLRIDGLAPDIVDMCGEIAQRAFGIDQAGFLRAGSAKTDKLHGVSSLFSRGDHAWARPGLTRCTGSLSRAMECLKSTFQDFIRT